MAEHNLDDFSVNRASLSIDRDVLERVNTVRHPLHVAALRFVVASLFLVQAAATSKHGQKRDWTQANSGNSWTPPAQPERTFDRCAYFVSSCTPVASPLYFVRSNKHQKTKGGARGGKARGGKGKGGKGAPAQKPLPPPPPPVSQLW